MIPMYGGVGGNDGAGNDVSILAGKSQLMNKMNNLSAL